MRTPFIWTLGLTVALPSLLLQEPAAAQEYQAGPESLGDTVRVGGDWALLDGPYDLGALDPPRETRYELRRTNLVLNRQGGALVREYTSMAYRRITGDMGAARFVWESFTALRDDGATPAVERDIPLPGGAEFLFDPEDFSLEAVDQVPAPEGSEVAFRVLVTDAVSWDILLGELWNRAGGPLEIGRQASMEPWDEPQPIPGGTYYMGRNSLRVAGITRVGGEPCLEINFAIEGSTVRLRTGGVFADGQEYFRGTLAVSLRDGRIVAGDFWGPVIGMFRQGEAEPGAELPLGGVMQHVTLREIQ